uniref:Uncharacterized protein n=1 Tax=Polytomella parva TaxID=51329 RepID=A0A7S0Y715_9CHLO
MLGDFVFALVPLPPPSPLLPPPKSPPFPPSPPKLPPSPASSPFSPPQSVFSPPPSLPTLPPRSFISNPPPHRPPTPASVISPATSVPNSSSLNVTLLSSNTRLSLSLSLSITPSTNILSDIASTVSTSANVGKKSSVSDNRSSSYG